MFSKFKDWYNHQSQTTKCFLWLIPLLILGIILRWNTILAGISKGFEFF